MSIGDWSAIIAAAASVLTALIGLLARRDYYAAIDRAKTTEQLDAIRNPPQVLRLLRRGAPPAALLLLAAGLALGPRVADHMIAARIERARSPRTTAPPAGAGQGSENKDCVPSCRYPLTCKNGSCQGTAGASAQAPGKSSAILSDGSKDTQVSAMDGRAPWLGG